MVHRWRCGDCGRRLWSTGEGRLRRAAKSHLFEHHGDRVSKAEFKLSWSCPYCGAEDDAYDAESGVEAFRDHLYRHAAGAGDSGVHVADGIDRRGSVLLKASAESEGAESMRRHFFPLADVCVLVTNNPEARVRLLDRTRSEWPAWTTVLTTKRRPLAEPMEIDFDDVPIEVVQMDRSFGPDQLGETVSRVIDAQRNPGEKLVFEFDILPELIRAFELRRSYEFLRSLSSRLRAADALSLFYLNPDVRSAAVSNLIDGEFDMELTADGRVFAADP